jgi:hypothetical protein
MNCKKINLKLLKVNQQEAFQLFNRKEKGPQRLHEITFQFDAFYRVLPSHKKLILIDFDFLCWFIGFVEMEVLL